MEIIISAEENRVLSMGCGDCSDCDCGDCDVYGSEGCPDCVCYED